ncbi:M1 family aminopeptidase, partial [Thermodesulfobacteriota bacterium]
MRPVVIMLTIALALLVNPGAARAETIDFSGRILHPDRAGHVERLSGDAAAGLAKLQRDRAFRGLAGRDSNGYDFQTLTVDMTIDPVAGTVNCTSVLELLVTASGQKDFYFYFDPFDEFSVSDESGPLPTQYYGSFGAVRVHYFDAPEQGEALELTFTNTGVPPCEPDPFFGMLFCMLTPELFYNIASYFAPGVVAFEEDDRDDTYHVDASMTIPVGYEVAASLDPVETVDNGDGTETRTFTRFIPVASPFSFSAAPYDVLTTETADGVDLTMFTIPGANEHAQAYLDASTAVMELYWDTYRPYLFSKHHLAQAAQELGGGVAAASATFYYLGSILYDPSLYYTESIFAHEIGHQWWGHMIPIKDFYAPWLNEGLTQFSAYFFGEQIEGASSIAWEMNYYGQYYDYYVVRAHPEWD